jgi:hypothetical protein
MKILPVLILSLLFAYCNNAGDQKKPQIQLLWPLPWIAAN